MDNSAFRQKAIVRQLRCNQGLHHCHQCCFMFCRCKHWWRKRRQWNSHPGGIWTRRIRPGEEPPHHSGETCFPPLPWLPSLFLLLGSGWTQLTKIVQTAPSGAQLCQASASQDSLYIRAACGSGKQVQGNTIPVSVWTPQPSSVAQPDGDAGQNLVSEPKDKMEETKSWNWWPGPTRKQQCCDPSSRK